MKNKKIWVIAFAEAMMALFFLITFFICLTGTQHHIAWYKELFVTGCMLCFILIGFFFLKHFESFLVTYEKRILVATLIIWSTFLYIFCSIAKNEPVNDFASVYDSAYNFVYGGEINWIYFARWRNNFPLFLLLSGLIKLYAIAGG